MGSAYAEFSEAEKGSLEVGKLADLVVLSADPTRVAPAGLLAIDVDMTIVGGRVVYDRNVVAAPAGPGSPVPR